MIPTTPARCRWRWGAARRPSAHRLGAITTILDTGFSDWLSLTDEQVAMLGLLPSGVAESELADGSIVPVTLYTAIVVWEGREGYRLIADFTDNGILQLTHL